MPLPPLPRRDRLRRLLRRRRRPIAAALAGAGVLVALAGLGSPQPPSSSSATMDATSPRLAPDEVAVPIVLASSVLTSALSVGDVVDVIGMGDNGAVLLAARARVLEIPPGSSGFGGSAGSLVIIATRPSEGLAVSAATASGPVSFLIREQARSG